MSSERSDRGGHPIVEGTSRISGIPLTNSKHEHFAHVVAKGESPARAYIGCGYSDSGAIQSGNRLLRKADVAVRVKELKTAVSERQVEKFAVDRVWVLRMLTLQNKEAIYGVLFHCSAQTLIEIAADPKRFGAEIGFFGVLHTWNQKLQHHPHVHCVVAAGGLSCDHARWVRPRNPRFFLSEGVLSEVFRGKFLEALQQAHASRTTPVPRSASRLGATQAVPKFDPPALCAALGGLLQATFRRTR